LGNLAYCERLGLWGEGCPFLNFEVRSFSFIVICFVFVMFVFILIDREKTILCINIEIDFFLSGGCVRRLAAHGRARGASLSLSRSLSLSLFHSLSCACFHERWVHVCVRSGQRSVHGACISFSLAPSLPLSLSPSPSYAFFHEDSVIPCNQCSGHCAVLVLEVEFLVGVLFVS